MMKSYDTSGNKGGFTRPQAQCLAERVVNTVGVDKLKAAGVTPSDVRKDTSNPFKAVGKNLSRSEAENLVGVILVGECFNFTDLVLKSASSGSNTFKSVAASKVRCRFDSLLSDPVFKRAMADSIIGRAARTPRCRRPSATGRRSSTS